MSRDELLTKVTIALHDASCADTCDISTMGKYRHRAEIVLPLIEADALERAADDIQALHPGEVKNSVIWLRERASRVRGKE